MIERNVFVKLKSEHCTDEGRAQFAQYTKAALAALPQVVDVRVGTPAEPKSAASWDISIGVWFRSVEDMEAYVVDPEHRRYVDEYMTPKTECKKAWNFVVEDVRDVSE